MTSKSDALDLDLREGLPEALRVLLREYPAETWSEHPGFDGLIRFWLDRHMMFRRIMERLRTDAESRLDGNIAPDAYKSGLARLGSAFVGELHGHHGIEDAHYFPVLARHDPRIAAGFDILDRDHHALDGSLNRFVELANGVMRASEGNLDAIGRFRDDLDGLERFLDRHLIDEEELVVPVLLKYGTAGLH